MGRDPDICCSACVENAKQAWKPLYKDTKLRSQPAEKGEEGESASSEIWWNVSHICWIYFTRPDGQAKPAKDICQGEAPSNPSGRWLENVLSAIQSNFSLGSQVTVCSSFFVSAWYSLAVALPPSPQNKANWSSHIFFKDGTMIIHTPNQSNPTPFRPFSFISCNRVEINSPAVQLSNISVSALHLWLELTISLSSRRSRSGSWRLWTNCWAGGLAMARSLALLWLSRATSDSPTAKSLTP